MHEEGGKSTIYDVAERAGVAISTVSRVLNDSSEVSRSTRARVENAIESLHFRPDRTARALAHHRFHTLAVAIPTFTTPFHNELLKGIRSELLDGRMDLLLCDLGSRLRARTLLSFLSRGAVDGLLLAGVQIDSVLAEELQALQAPVVLIGSSWSTFDSFVWDERTGARKAVEHLLQYGHRSIGFIQTNRESRIQSLRTLGYKEALANAGVPFDPAVVAGGDIEKHGGYSEEAGYEAMIKLLSRDPGITAVFASSDVQAVGAWAAITESGLRVPDDIALVGYDDIKTSRFIGLSSVDQNMQETGRLATEILLARVTGSRISDPVITVNKPELVVRRSSKFIRTT